MILSSINSQEFNTLIISLVIVIKSVLLAFFVVVEEEVASVASAMSAIFLKQLAVLHLTIISIKSFLNNFCRVSSKYAELLFDAFVILFSKIAAINSCFLFFAIVLSCNCRFGIVAMEVSLE